MINYSDRLKIKKLYFIYQISIENINLEKSKESVIIRSIISNIKLDSKFAF